MQLLCDKDRPALLYRRAYEYLLLKVSFEFVGGACQNIHSFIVSGVSKKIELATSWLE